MLSILFGILLDIFVLWFLLNYFSDESWDDRKLKVCGILLAIAILGGLAARFAADYVGAFAALGAYFLVGTVCLWGLASLEIKKALAAMGIFMGYKIVIAVALILLLTR